MLFNSFEFIIFFPVVALLYFLLPFRFRCYFLLAASYFFYMCWKPSYVILLILCTVINYWAARIIGAAENHVKRKNVLVISLIINIAMLFWFKYVYFLDATLRSVLNNFHMSYKNITEFDILLPIGISFYTFQSISYIIDVYRGKQKPENNLAIFALYISFFPQLVAGPIERSARMLPQYYHQYSFNYQRAASGVRLIIWGLFKKMVIADRLALYVDAVYNNPGEHHGMPVVLATYFFAFQIFCDFSGYSDIAIGAARVMGYRLMDNFKAPYLAQSIPEFWRRWHISLSTWFRDYLYIPLGGNQVPKVVWAVNILLVFLVCGLWHGASWNYVVWGALNGLYIVASRLTRGVRKRLCAFLHIEEHTGLHIVVKIFLTFNLVCFAWIFFRAPTVHDALLIIQNMVAGFDAGSSTIALPQFGAAAIIGSILLIIIMESVHIVQRQYSMQALLARLLQAFDGLYMLC